MLPLCSSDSHPAPSPPLTLQSPGPTASPPYEKWLLDRASFLASSAMGLGCRYFVGLVLLWSLRIALGQGDFHRVSFSVLQHEYDCGDYGMQLLVFPSQGRTVRFKVVGK